MAEYFDICGTHIPISTIKDFRTIKVEFVFRPVFRESKKTMMTALAGKKYEFAYMEPYAAIIGQQGHKSELGEYKAKDFKEALGKDISGAVIYTIADALKLKAFKRQKYQCVNLAGRAFTTYLDDVPAKMMWADGRVAEVYKEDKLYTVLNEITTPGVEYISALVIKASEVFCFYGDGVQLVDAGSEYERLKREQEVYLHEKNEKKIGAKGKIVMRTIPKFRLLGKTAVASSAEAVQQYICLKKGNEDRHQALVSMFEKEETYPVVRYVYAQVMRNSAKVIVEWNSPCEEDYPCEFTSSNSIFHINLCK